MSRMNGKKTHTHTRSTLLYSSIIRLYPQNSVFEIVHDESLKVYLHMYNGNVQQKSNRTTGGGGDGRKYPLMHGGCDQKGPSGVWFRISR